MRMAVLPSPWSQLAGHLTPFDPDMIESPMPSSSSPQTGRSPRELVARLRAIGQRATPQRLLILGAFRDPGEHLAAEEVYERVGRLSPAVNRSTVYRTLELFRDAGLISETDLGGGVRQFELLGYGRHHHLICRQCNTMAELDDDVVAPLRDQLKQQYGFEATIDHLALFGTCAHCQGESDGLEQ